MGGPSRVLVDPVDPMHNRRHIARSLGMLFLIEGTLGQVWLLLPHEAGRPLPLVGICILAQVLGVWMRRGGLDLAPLWVLKAMTALGTLLGVVARPTGPPRPGPPHAYEPGPSCRRCRMASCLRGRWCWASPRSARCAEC